MYDYDLDLFDDECGIYRHPCEGCEDAIYDYEKGDYRCTSFGACGTMPREEKDYYGD